jgi:hypothetical protein
MLIRVTVPGTPAFQLRKGEEGVSVFDTEAVKPELTTAEILENFRPGSTAIDLDRQEIKNRGMQVVPIPGAPFLPERLQEAHAEIRPVEGLTRGEFKQRLKELE